MAFLSKLFKSNSNIKNITSETLKNQLDSYREIQLVDVRTKAEYEQKHIPKAINIDVFSSNFEYECQTKFDKSEPVFLYCRSGQRSMKAARKLEKVGFLEIYNLKGGMIAWSRI